MDSEGDVRRGQSCAQDGRVAVAEFCAAVAQPDMALVLFFCSADYDLDVLAAEMAAAFGGICVVGCTTAGEIGPAGWCRHSLVGASFASGAFNVVADCLTDLGHFDAARGRHFAESLRAHLASRVPESETGQTFALQLIDGLSGREEPVTRAFQLALNGTPLIGGSAGDGLRFQQTRVYWQGCFHADAALLVLVETTLPTRTLMVQHFQPGNRRVVVTAADPAHRIVREIDGLPAAVAYAELVGVGSDQLDPQRFAASPMVVLIGGAGYVRSISKVLPDGSLRFFCAIEEGMVLRLAERGDLVDNLEQALAAVDAEIGPPQLLIGCDCILRRVEIEQRQLVDQVTALLERHNAIGFGTYGEQYRGVHVNQTFTGIAIGRRTGMAHG